MGCLVFALCCALSLFGYALTSTLMDSSMESLALALHLNSLDDLSESQSGEVPRSYKHNPSDCEDDFPPRYAPQLSSVRSINEGRLYSMFIEKQHMVPLGEVRFSRLIMTQSERTSVILDLPGLLLADLGGVSCLARSQTIVSLPRSTFFHKRSPHLQSFLSNTISFAGIEPARDGFSWAYRLLGLASAPNGLVVFLKNGKLYAWCGQHPSQIYIYVYRKNVMVEIPDSCSMVQCGDHSESETEADDHVGVPLADNDIVIITSQRLTTHPDLSHMLYGKQEPLARWLRSLDMDFYLTASVVID